MAQRKENAVCLTFDMDGETIPYIMDPDNAARGCPSCRRGLWLKLGVPTQICPDLYEIQASFFIPGRVVKSIRTVIQEVKRRGMISAIMDICERPDFER
jgi:hypothetical protein